MNANIHSVIIQQFWSGLLSSSSSFLRVEGESQRHQRPPFCSVLCSSDGFRHCRLDPVFNVICPPPSWSALQCFLVPASYTSVEQESIDYAICSQQSSHIRNIAASSPVRLSAVVRVCSVLLKLTSWSCDLSS